MIFSQLKNEYNNVRVMLKHNKHGNFLCLNVNKKNLESDYDIVEYLEISLDTYFNLFKNFKYEIINKELYFFTDEEAMSAANYFQSILPKFLIFKKLYKSK